MAEPRKFSGSNRILGAPSGLESIVIPLHVYGSGKESISCWKLTPEELEVVNESGCIWVSVASGESQPPIYISGFPLMEARDSEGNLIKYSPDDPNIKAASGIDTLELIINPR